MYNAFQNHSPVYLTVEPIEGVEGEEGAPEIPGESGINFRNLFCFSPPSGV